MATIEIPDYLLEGVQTSADELNAELAALSPKKAVERLQDLSKELETLIYLITYEFRTPITAIVGYTQLLSSSDPRLKLDVKKRLIMALRESAESMTRELDDVFDLLRYGSESLELEIKEIDLNEIIKQVLSTVSNHIDYSYERADKDKQQIVKPKFEAIIPNELPMVSVDAARIHRILIQTLSQAVRIYNRKKEGVITFTVSCNDHRVEINIIDDGTGLPSHLIGEVPRLLPAYEPIIEMHGGSMRVTQETNGRWIVTIILPIH